MESSNFFDISYNGFVKYYMLKHVNCKSTLRLQQTILFAAALRPGRRLLASCSKHPSLDE